MKLIMEEITRENHEVSDCKIDVRAFDRMCPTSTIVWLVNTTVLFLAFAVSMH